MGAESKIEWTDSTWPIISGCDYESSGCANCFAVREAWRMAHNPNPKISNVYEGVVDKRHGRLRWTGLVKTQPQRLDWPLKWKKPRMIFVCDLSDLFHENVPIEFITDAFEIMAKCPQHTFQVLTKRVDRALSLMWNDIGTGVAYRLGKQREPGFWPLKNVWFGASVENQKMADDRISTLLRIPATVRFLSCAPLLGPIDLRKWLPDISQVIVEGESGPGARPMHPDWARGIRDQCLAEDVSFFFKQWGRYSEEALINGVLYGAISDDPDGKHLAVWPDGKYTVNWEPGPTMKAATLMFPFGKKAAGRVLDGRTWNEMPERKLV